MIPTEILKTFFWFGSILIAIDSNQLQTQKMKHFKGLYKQKIDIKWKKSFFDDLISMHMPVLKHRQ